MRALPPFSNSISLNLVLSLSLFWLSGGIPAAALLLDFFCVDFSVVFFGSFGLFGFGGFVAVLYVFFLLLFRVVFCVVSGFL